MAMEAYASRTDKVHTDVLFQAREACYKARDAFYACLEKQSDKKPTEIGSVGLLYPVECKSSRADFEKNCRASWVKHFDRQHCRNKRVQRLLDDKETRRGPLSLPQPYTFKPTAAGNPQLPPNYEVIESHPIVLTFDSAESGALGKTVA